MRVSAKNYLLKSASEHIRPLMTRAMVKTASTLLVMLVCLAYMSDVVVVHLSAAERRVVTPNDIVNLETIDGVSLAPDGQTMAFVRHRPMASAPAFDRRRADVWVARTASAEAPTAITNGAVDGTSYWMPMWSPDGARLAMLSTQDGSNVRLNVWNKDTRRVTTVGEGGVALVPFPAGAPPFAWVDNRRLIAVYLPESDRSFPRMMFSQRSEAIESHERAKARVGEEATASVLDSGVRVELADYPQQRIALIDLDGKIKPIDSAVSIRGMSIAPDRSHIVFLNQVALEQPDPNTLLRFGFGNEDSTVGRFQLELVDRDGHIIPLTGDRPQYVKPKSVNWAPGGGAFAFVGRAQDGSKASRVFRGSVSGAIELMRLEDGAEPDALVWADDNRLLVLAERKITADVDVARRSDWLMFSGSGVRNVTKTLKSVPDPLLPVSGGRVLVGVAEKDLWRLDVESGTWTNLTASLDTKIAGLLWPTIRQTESRVVADRAILVSVQEGLRDKFCRLDVTSGALTCLTQLSDLPTAALAEYNDHGDIAVFIANEASRTVLTVVHDKVRRTVLESNTFLRDIVEGTVKAINYNSLDGESLKGWIVLPVRYDPSRRYPLVTWVYPSQVYGDMPPRVTRLNSPFELNLQLLAARSYAVLLPSMPLHGSTDPYPELTKGVLPAVDEAIRLGIADPAHLAVMGTSYGGFGTYGLVAQTNRFHAGIAFAGLSNLISLYGTFGTPYRYEPLLQDHFVFPGMFETGSLRMLNPPWKDFGRYIRNSPIFYVDRIQTPLMIVQGDLDAVSITQGEELFTALYREGKRARFVRYWGEEHELASPANIRDVWNRIYEWLDAFLGTSVPAGAVATP